MSDIGDPHIAHGSAGTLGARYVGSAAPIGHTMQVVPPQAQPGMRVGGEQKRRTGLVPATARARFPVITNDKPRARVDPRRIATLRATVRRLEVSERSARGPWVESTAQGANPSGDEKLREAYLSAVNALAAARKDLTEAEESAKGRPRRVELVEVREPSAVAHAFDPSYPAPRFRCLHDRCQGDEWEDEGAMRRAHPSNNDMAQSGQCHVFALYSDAPIDPADPEGETVGLVAPIAPTAPPSPPWPRRSTTPGRARRKWRRCGRASPSPPRCSSIRSPIT